MDQLLGSRLIERLYDKAEFLVSDFLSRLFANQRAEFLDPGPQSTALMAIALAANKRPTK